MIRVGAGQVAEQAGYAAAHLRQAGVAAGDRVAVAPLVPASLVDAAEAQSLTLPVVMAALRTGAVPVMVNPSLGPAERDYVLADCQPKLTLSSVASLAALVEPVSTVGTELADHLITRAMHYTSGTTGNAKGVWNGFLSPELQKQWWDDQQDQWQFEASDTTLAHGPLAHSAPLRFAMLTAMAGGEVLLPGRFDADLFVRALAEEKPTTAFTVPEHLSRLLARDDLPPSPYRVLAHAGSACSPALKRKIHAWAGVDHTVEFYSATEGTFTHCLGKEWEEHPGTLGRARPGRHLFIDEGMIWSVMPDWADFEYWGAPEKTAAAWRTLPDGSRAMTVGDLGRLDEDDYLYLDGRREDLIISGGINVYPAIVEAALQTIPGVVEAAVFGVDDEQWGQRVCAAYIGAIAPDELAQAAKPQLAKYQLPKEFHQLDELPRTATGKLRRLSLPYTLDLL